MTTTPTGAPSPEQSNLARGEHSKSRMQEDLIAAALQLSPDQQARVLAAIELLRAGATAEEIAPPLGLPVSVVREALGPVYGENPEKKSV